MRFRKLRIAWSVACGIVCLLLTALWVRSYQNGPGEGYMPAPPSCCIRSTDGILFILRMAAPDSAANESSRYMASYQDPYEGKPLDFVPTKTWSGVLVDWRSLSFWYVQMPYWLLVGTSLVFTVIPAIYTVRRFSLRTLLIATTLVAVVMGLIVWSVR